MDKNNPLVSISIPIFKCEKYIERCLKSVEKQTYKNIEVILVNDCTPDESMKIVKDFIQENPSLNIKVLEHEENSGLSVVRNSGINDKNAFSLIEIRMADGKAYYFLDQPLDWKFRSRTIKLLRRLPELSSKIREERTLTEGLASLSGKL
ncbi:MAG TPA: hypothetical protein DD740_12330 [Chryseobacterium sp.]|nr:hypothetical protein [Chryseobacterium sp.]